MENLNLILDYIARTNLFNFVIFLTIILFLVKKLNVGEKMEKSALSVKESVDVSENIKAEAQEKLDGIEESIAHIEDEIVAIITTSENNAKLVGEKIVDDAKKSALTIKENTQKALENSKDLLKNDILRRVALASVEVAKSHIREELHRNQDLHSKLIDESISAIEGIEL